MEAVPRLPMLSFDLKHSPEYVEFAPALKQYIQEHYGEDPALYNKACAEIEQLRQSAVHVSRDFIGCTTLKKYYAQLQFLQGRFPLGEGENSMVFTWEDIQTGREHVIADIKFEQACILYNIGCLHSILGAIDTRQNAEGMKVSCTHFQCAAWAFEHLRDHFGSSAMSTDMAHEMLTYQIQLMLAQGQECILEKSMIDSRKNTITAKVAAQVVEFYKTAIKNLDVCNSESLVNSRSFKEWRKRMEYKVSFYQCIMYYYTGKESEEKSKWGETLAYYTASHEKLQESIKAAKNEIPEIIDALKFTQDVVAGKYNSAKKDNDFVYHDKVPPLDSLPEIKGASLVKGIPFNPNDPEISGADIFQKLVPMEAHEASSVYSEEKAKLLRMVSGEVDDKNVELDQFLSSLQIDVNKLNPAIDRLPDDLLEKCAALSVRTHAIKDLIDQMSAVSSVSTDVDLNLTEILELLEEESKREEDFQKLFGNRTNNMILSDIRKEANACQIKHRQGTLSNENLHTAMNTHITNLRLLAGPPDQILTSLPSLQPNRTTEDESIIEELRKLLGKIDEMKSQRLMLYEQLRDQIQSDDITNVLVTQDGSNREAIFDEQLKKHDKLKTLLDQNMSAQNNILQALTDCNAKYATIRQDSTEAVVRRESRVKELINSYNVYEDLMAKSQKGLDYYKKLEETVNRLLQRCRGVCKVQQEERDQISARFAAKAQPPSRPSAPKPMSPAPSSPQPTLPSNDGPKLKDYLPFMKPATFGPKSKAGSGNPPPNFPPTVPDPALFPQGMDYNPTLAMQNLPDPDVTLQGSKMPDVAAQAYSYENKAFPGNLPTTFVPGTSSQFHSNISQYAERSRSHPAGPGARQDMYRQDSTSTVSSVDTPVLSPTNESQHGHIGQLPYQQQHKIAGQQGVPPNAHTYQSIPQAGQQGYQAPGSQSYVPPKASNMTNPRMPFQPSQGNSYGSGYSQASQMSNYSHTGQMSQQDSRTSSPALSETGSISQNVHQQPQNPSQVYKPQQGYSQSEVLNSQNVNQQFMPGGPKLAQTINQSYPTNPGLLSQVQGHGQIPNQNIQSQMPQGSYQTQPGHSFSPVQYQQPGQYTQQPGPSGQLTQIRQPGPSGQYSQNQQPGPSGQLTQIQQPGLSGQYTQNQQPGPSGQFTQNQQPGPSGQLTQIQQPGQSGQYIQNQQQNLSDGSSSYKHGQNLQHPSPAASPRPHYPPVSNPQYNPNTGQSYAGNAGVTQGQNVPQNLAGYQHSGGQQISPAHQYKMEPQNYPYQNPQQPGQSVYPNQSSTGQNQGSSQVQYAYQQPQNVSPHHAVNQSQHMPHMSQPYGTSVMKQVPTSQQTPNQPNTQYAQQLPQNQNFTAQQQQARTVPYSTQNVYQGPTSHQPGQRFQNQQTPQSYTSMQQPTAATQSFPSSSSQGFYQKPMGQSYPNMPQSSQAMSHPGQTAPQYPSQNIPNTGSRGQNWMPHTTQSGMVPISTTYQSTQPVNPISSQYQNQQQFQPRSQGTGPSSLNHPNQIPGGQSQYPRYPTNQPSGVHPPGSQSTYQQQFVPQGGSRMPTPAAKLPGNLQQPLQPLSPASSPSPSPAPVISNPLRFTTPIPQMPEESKLPLSPQEPLPSPATSQIGVASGGNVGLARQSSSLDEILSSSPDSVKQAAIPDPVIAPKVLTAQEKQQQKEEAMKNRCIPESKDPYSSQAALNKLVMDVERFGKRVDELSSGNPCALSHVDTIWRELMDFQEQESKKHSIAIARCYPMKNRDQDIMPYDATRVMLSTVKDDYINASWINDLAPSCPKFITTQTPLPVTTTDFWVMVYEQGTEVVVMITSEYETGKKFPIYWPTEKGKAMEHGQIILNLQSVKYKGLWTERIIYMLHTETKQGRTIVHLLYKHWPVSGFPDDVSHIVKFINETHTFYKQQRSLMKPVIVHCGNGIGRSGTFLLIYTGMQEILHGNGMIEIPILTKRMLSKRKNCIQNPEQLRFAYEALLYFAEDFLKRRNILVQNPHYSKQKPKPPAAHTPADDIVLGSVNLQTIQQNVGRLGEKHEKPSNQGQTTITDSPTKGESLSSLPDLIQQQTKTDNVIGGNNLIQTNLENISQDNGSSSPQNRSRSGSSSSILSSGSLSSVNSKSSPQHSSKVEMKSSPLADLQNPNTFTLDSNDKGRKRITKASFSTAKKTSIKDNLDTSDPLSNLDPLWSIGKDKK